MQPTVAVDSVRFGYRNHPVLQGITLTVMPGEVVAILGPNGVGKTTLVEHLIGTLSPQAGTVRVLGTDPRRADATFWSQIGLVQQHWSDHGRWRVVDQVDWILTAHRSAGSATRERDELLQAVGMAGTENKRLNQLSGGQRRRIDLASALVAHPALLLLDEPTTGLDPVAKAQVHDLIGAAQDASTTVLLTTHDLAEAEKVASRIIVLNGGRIVADGSARHLREALVGKAEVSWMQDGVTHLHATDEVEGFLSTLNLAIVSNLTITRPSLEDAYLTLVTQEDR